MGTIALITVFDEDGDKLLGIHVQHDGGNYLKTKLETIISNGRYVNSLGLTKSSLGKQFLGMGCFAATLITHLKKECGGVHITTNTNHSNIYDYTYNISFNAENRKIILE